ncbi:MAG: DUF1592 domain-containing protein [Verrucomicrobia bacterium]|nr:DUF1592 domain-containing protein [Verrucomicrobiota bacterium]
MEIFARLSRHLTGMTALLASTAWADTIVYPSQVRPILEAHCFKCHGEKKQKGKLRLDTLSAELTEDRRAAEHWHDVRDALNLGEMPPEEEPELALEDRRVLVAWINQEIDALLEAKHSTGGRVVLRRLNRAEYQNTMRDLLGIDTDYAKNLPPEGFSEDGFRNNGSALQMSDLQLEYYLNAAREGLRKAIVTGPRPETFSLKFEKTHKDKNRGSNILDKDQEFIAKLMDYPEQGRILIRARARAKLANGRGYPQLRAAIGYRADVQAPRAFIDPIDVTSEEWQDFEFTARMEQFPLPSKTQSKFPGLLIWLDNAYAEGRNKPLKVRGNGKKQQPKEGPLNYPHIEIASMEFVGPVFDKWPPAHHTSILIPSENRADEKTYAGEVVGHFMQRAFRRPVKEEEVLPYLRYFGTVRATCGSFEEAIRETLAMVLVSPDFLYLVEPAGETKRPVTDWELASRLSYFLWSTMPDKRLFELAENGKLHEPEILRDEVSRMLEDPRSWQFIEQFADQWLDVGALERVAVDPNHYPDFDNELKKSMRGETLHFFNEILRGDLSALNFLDSDFTMLDEPLANHYGLSGPRGSRFERVKLPDSDPRGGVLSHGSFLLGNSTGNDSHPVKRGVWILERLLDDPPSDPPPNVPELNATDPKFIQLPVREQLQLHREEASCNDCHRGIDPWGIALENFGADGLWRKEILRKKSKGKGMQGQAVESAATLPDGTEIAGLEELRSYLMDQRRSRFAEAFTSKLLTYSLGRSLEITDGKAVEELSSQFAESDYRIAALIQLVVASEIFHTK